MKKLLYLLPFFLVSCGKFRDGSSIWQGGLWLIPAVTFLAGCVFMYFGYRASKSGSIYYKKDAQGVNREFSSDENTPIYKTGQFVFAVIFWLATVGIIIWQNLEK